MATGTTPSATATADPEEEPPGITGSPRTPGGTGVPKWGLTPSPEKANSLMFVLPTQTIPAAASARTTAESCAAGGTSDLVREPAVVTVPATSKTSLTA